MIFDDTIVKMLPRLRTPVQLYGLAIFVVAAILIRTWLPGAVGAQISAAVLAILFIVFGQVFAVTDKAPQRLRAVFRMTALILFCVSVLALVLTTSLLVAKALRPKAVSLAGFSQAEQDLVNLSKNLAVIRGNYESLVETPANAPQVNKDARQLIGKMKVIDDRQLGLDIRIFKYQSLAYAWAIVARSESNANQKLEAEQKLKAVDEILQASNKAQGFITEVMKPGSYNQSVQDTRDWIKRDNALARIQRLSAIGLCTRWEVTKNPKDRFEVRQIIHSLPKEYLDGEQPAKSRALQPCLEDDGR